MPRAAWKQNRMLHAALWMLLLTGIILMLLPRVDAAIQERKQDRLLSGWTQEADTPVRDAPAASAAPVVEWKEIDGIPVMGTITIDKIDLQEPLLKGTDPKPLDLGIGVLETESSVQETAHLVLAGHRSLQPGKHFNRLGELQRGDLIVIESTGGTNTYQVERSFLVEPDDLSVLTSRAGETEVTLITCHPMRNPTHRLIVKAALVKG